MFQPQPPRQLLWPNYPYTPPITLQALMRLLEQSLMVWEPLCYLLQWLRWQDREITLYKGKIIVSERNQISEYIDRKGLQYERTQTYQHSEHNLSIKLTNKGNMKLSHALHPGTRDTTYHCMQMHISEAKHTRDKYISSTSTVTWKGIGFTRFLLLIIQCRLLWVFRFLLCRLATWLV